MLKQGNPPPGATGDGSEKGSSREHENSISRLHDVRKVAYYGGGVLLSAGGLFKAGKHQRSRRGEITGWSKSSRRRMRRFLLECAPPDGWPVFGVTLTIPGPPLPEVEEKALFKGWARECQRRGWCAVWRLELQARGARHWHCLVSTPPGKVARIASDLRELWWDILSASGPRSYDPPHKVGKMLIESVGSLLSLPGAMEHSVDVQREGGRGAWLRYLQDHATKAKQGQTAAGKGRQWGVVGRSLFRRQTPSSVDLLSDRQYSVFLRAYQRLCTPSKRCSCVFGSRLGWRPLFGGRGEAVRFSRPETVKRLVEWARTT